MDITYCSNYGCINKACIRHTENAPDNGKPMSICSFRDCEFYKKYLAELAEKERQEAIEEARRESYKLEDNDDSLKYTHSFGG